MAVVHDPVESLLLAYVPDVLGFWPEGQRFDQRVGTLVSADISGFTALSERLATRGREGAEMLSALICECFEGMIEICARKGGDILKFGGDSLLVWFEGERNVERACRASVDMRRALSRQRRTPDGKRLRLSVSIGVHHGQQTFIAVTGGHTDLVITGPGTTATVDAETAAAGGEILLTHPTAALLPASWLGEQRAEGVILARVFGSIPWIAQPRSGRRPAADFVPLAQQPQIMAGAINEHRQAAITFIGFSGTDQLIATGQADELADRLQRFTEVLVDLCTRYEVFWLATDTAHDGGKFVLTVGAPISPGDNEDRLLRAVREIIDADPGLGLHAGVNRGYIFAGDLGSATRRTYTTLGDAMNLSARLSAKAQPGQIVVSHAVLNLAEAPFETEPMPPFLVKGKALPIHASRLGRFNGRLRGVTSPTTALYGRTSELSRLQRMAAVAVVGHGAAVMITGEPGVGKTRLAAELVRTAPTMDSIVVRCRPIDRLTAYAAAQPFLRTMLGIAIDADPVDAGATLVARLARLDGRHGTSYSPMAPLLADSMGAEVAPTVEAAAVVSEFRAARTRQLIVQLVGDVVRSPALVFVDDLDRADDASRELWSALIDSCRRLPLLLVATAASSAAPPGGTVLTLTPLADEDVAALVDDLLGDHSATTAAVRSVVQRAGGNALFVTEMVSAIADGGGDHMPDTLEDLLLSRIDTLDPAHRQLLRLASVLGDTCDLDLLATMAGDPTVLVPTRWSTLDEFVEPISDTAMRFRYDSYRTVLYEGLSFRHRRRLHDLVVDALESLERRGDDRDDIALLAYHAVHGGRRERAWRYAVAAGRSAADASSSHDASRFYGAALTNREAAASALELADVAEQAANVMEITGQIDQAQQALAIASRASKDPLGRARLARKRAAMVMHSGDYTKARRLLRTAERTLDESPWEQAIGERAHCQSVRSGLALRESRLDEAWAAATQALAQAMLIEDWPTAAHAGMMVDNLVTHLGWKGVAVERPPVLELYGKANDPVGAARYLSNRAVDFYYDGDWVESERLYRECADRAATFGHVVSEATCRNNIAEILSDQGHYDQAATMLRQAGRSFRAVGFPLGATLVTANLGRLASRQGNVDDAERHLNDAIERFVELDAGSFIVEARLREIENRLLRGDTVRPDELPTEDDCAQDPTLEIYADRLQAFIAPLDQAKECVERSIAAARQAGLPFDLAQSLRVCSVLFNTVGTYVEATNLFDGLGVVTAPPMATRSGCVR